LRGNTLLETPLEKEDIKPRLLGHFGTGPGLVLI
jgi:xylulose-5-phosphate/fructose-6-phosphate phosphoketolase